MFFYEIEKTPLIVSLQSTIENEDLLDRNGNAIVLPSFSQESGWGGDENASVDADAGSIDLD